MKLINISIMTMVMLFAVNTVVSANRQQQQTVLDSSEHVTIIPRYKMAAYDKQIITLYAKQPAQQTRAQRIDYFSKAFLQQPYMGGALGEGQYGQFDKSPLYRTDGFDCMTLVSTVLALVNANNLINFKKQIKKARYHDGKVTYRNRNHFTSLDWNVNNQALGLIKDVTNTVHDMQGRPLAKIASAYIDKQAWYADKSLSIIKLFSLPKPAIQQQLLTKLHNQKRYVKNRESHLPYIPFDRLYDQQGQPNTVLFDQIPSGSIIEIVRPNWDLVKQIGTHLNVSHLGFALRINEQLMYREASTVEHKVIDIALADYLKRYLNSPTARGINIQQVL